MSNALMLAISWEPEIRGITTVAIAVGVLMGSVYLLLMTNLGSRLGFMVSFAGFFGWMFLMGGIWWVYGIGLQGEAPSWKPEGVIVGEARLAEEEVTADLADEEKWHPLAADNPQRGQIQAAADEVLVIETKVFPSADASGPFYIPEHVYSKGGATYPEWFFNLFHEKHYALVQVRPTARVQVEPGKAAATPVADEKAPVYSVLLIRDLGYRRLPAASICIGSGIIFGLSCMALHRRDRVVAEHRSAPAIA
ncbi:MAG: hypothetical protein AB7L13_03045 [Acidimicrobiia bacterium]